MYLRVLWTNQLTKKRKTWQDGFLELKEETGQRSVLLLKEDRTRLASGRLPSSLQVTEDLEGAPVPPVKAETIC